MSRPRVLLTTVILTAGCLCGGCADFENLFEFQPTFRDLAYGAQPRQRLDLYVPGDDVAGGPWPVVVWVHGGRFSGGDKFPAYPAELLTDAGLAVASVNYRFATDAPFPAQIHDLKGAVRWLRAHADEYGLDPERVGVWGRSAGGGLAALLGTSGGVAELEGDVGGNLEFSSRVGAAADYFGPTNAFTLAPFVLSCDRDPLLLERCIIDIVANQDDPAWAPYVELARLASPVFSVTPDDPPFFIAHGLQDLRLPVTQSLELHEALREADVPVELEILPGYGHGDLPAEVDEAVRDFFLAELGGGA